MEYFKFPAVSYASRDVEILKSFAFGLFFGLAKLSLKSHEKHEDENTVSAPSKILSEQDISEVIEMALSDNVSF